MIEVKNVSKKYGDFYAVKDISFTIMDGEIVGFLGRNGAGKTTTMNMITGFIEATDGEILVGGQDVDLKPQKVKAMIGYMPESTPLYTDLTVKEFVTYMAELKNVSRKKKKEAVEKAIKNTGLETVVNKLTRNLSRGFKQRVSLAGAIVGDPDILILDEPTVGLDPEQVIEIRELIKSFKKDHTVILSSHILTEVSQICEKVIIIDKGEIIAVDTPENLEKNTDKKSTYRVTVEDKENIFAEVFKDNDIILNFKEVSKNEDGTFVYEIEPKSEANDDKAFRRKFAVKCAENDILNLGIEKTETSLEDAFIGLIEKHDKEQAEKEAAEKAKEELEKEEKETENDNKEEIEETVEEKEEVVEVEEKVENKPKTKKKKKAKKEDKGGNE